jgi:hypothetical protein
MLGQLHSYTLILEKGHTNNKQIKISCIVVQKLLPLSQIKTKQKKKHRNRKIGSNDRGRQVFGSQATNFGVSGGSGVCFDDQPIRGRLGL